MYFIDELNGGNIYKYTSAARLRRGQERAGRLLRRRPDASCCASATAPRRTPPARTPGCRFTDADGAALPGALTITDPNGVTSVDARNTTNLPAFKGTDYQRPEDMQIQTLKGRRVSLRDDDHHARGLPARSEEQNDLGLRRPEHHRPGHAVSRWATHWRTSTTSRSTTTATSTSSRTRGGGVDDDIWFAEGSEQRRRPDRSGRRHRALGVERHGRARSSPASTSIRPTSAAPGSTSSIPTAATTGTIEIRIPKH